MAKCKLRPPGRRGWKSSSGTLSLVQSIPEISGGSVPGACPFRQVLASPSRSRSNFSCPHMKVASDEEPVQREMSMISRASLIRERTDSSWGRTSSGSSGDCLKVNLVEGVELAAVRAVLGGMVENLSCISWGKTVSYVGCVQRCKHTPLTILVPMRVTYPLTLSERNEDNTSVAPGSSGASSLTHSSRPSLRETKEDCSELRYHCSSFSCVVEALAQVQRWGKGTGVTPYQGLVLGDSQGMARRGRMNPQGHDEPLAAEQ